MVQICPTAARVTRATNVLNASNVAECRKRFEHSTWSRSTRRGCIKNCSIVSNASNGPNALNVPKRCA
eukprot:864776-Lingulodinium_polyedra.AAC.1